MTESAGHAGPSVTVPSLLYEPPYRLIVTLDFHDQDSLDDWLREHENGRCSDLAPWTVVESMTVDDGAQPPKAGDE